MRKFLIVLKFAFQLFRCMRCSLKNSCEHSVYFTLDNIDYFVSAKIVEDRRIKKTDNSEDK